RDHGQRPVRAAPQAPGVAATLSRIRLSPRAGSVRALVRRHHARPARDQAGLQLAELSHRADGDSRVFDMAKAVAVIRPGCSDSSPPPRNEFSGANSLLAQVFREFVSRDTDTHPPCEMKPRTVRTQVRP